MKWKSRFALEIWADFRRCNEKSIWMDERKLDMVGIVVVTQLTWTKAKRASQSLFLQSTRSPMGGMLSRNTVGKISTTRVQGIWQSTNASQ